MPRKHYGVTRIVRYKGLCHYRPVRQRFYTVEEARTHRATIDPSTRPAVCVYTKHLPVPPLGDVVHYSEG